MRYVSIEIKTFASVGGSIDAACPVHPCDAQNNATLLDIIEDGHDNKSTNRTSKVPVAKWHDVMRENTVNDAIEDQVTSESHRLELCAEWFRKHFKTAQSESAN